MKEYKIGTLIGALAQLPDDDQSIDDFCDCLSQYIKTHKMLANLTGVKPEDTTDGFIRWKDDKKNEVSGVDIKIVNE